MPVPDHFIHASTLSKDQLFASLQTQETGLSQQEVTKRLHQYGENKLTQKSKISISSLLIGQFTNVLTLILIASAGLILLVYFFGEHDPSDLVEAGLIFAIVVMIAALGFTQEYKAERSIESLKKLLAHKTRIKRDGKEQEIDVNQLVPGDIVILEEGAKIPADIRLLSVANLRVQEASLTGESTPVRKIIDTLSEQLAISDQKNMVFSGTTIASGRATGVVITTGDTTEIGKIATLVAESKEDETPIQKRLNTIGKMLGYIIVGICIVVFIFIVFFAKDFASLPLLQRILHSFIAAVSLAVAAIPEGLPGVVTITLALGTQRMLAKNALVRKLNSIETLGSTDVICSDKTGTLTKGEMTVTEAWFQNNLYTVSGSGYEPTGQFFQNGKQTSPSELQVLLETGLLCNNAKLENGLLLGDPTEGALLVSAQKAGVTAQENRVFEIPFSSERKKMSVVVKTGTDYFVYTKGAPEIILKNCKSIVTNGKNTSLDSNDQQHILETTQDMSSRALRVLGFAYKKISEKEYLQYKDNEKRIEENLIFLGLQGMIDPPRKEVKNLIAESHASGIRVIMITGDHAATATAIAKEIGISGDVLTGEQLEKFSDAEFAKKVEHIGIYARVNPEHKMRIVDALKKNNHIVAMTGDGVNDAPALKRADIGIAMGKTGTDVAKEASDMVLLDDLFSTIITAIQEGRGIFQNIRKFVTYLLACNIGEVLIVFFAVIFFQDVPLTATMLLWINVVTDGLPAVALGLDPTEKHIMRYNPKMFQGEIIPKRIWFEIGSFGLLMTIAVLSLYVLNLPEGLLEAKGAAFMAIVLFELLNIFMIRSRFNAPVFTNKWLWITVLGTVILQLGIVYIPFVAFIFEVKHIDGIDWVVIGIFCILLWLAFQAVQDIGLWLFPDEKA